MANEATRIVIAERWSVLRRGLIGVLQPTYTVVEEIERPDAVAGVLSSRPVDVVVLGDEAGPSMEATIERSVAAAANGGGRASVVLLADDMDVERLRKLLRTGVRAVLSKRIAGDELLDALARVLAGERVVDQHYLPMLYEDEDVNASVVDDSPLTAREMEVLVELARGSSNRQIADALYVGEATVKTHLSNIYAKLGVEGRTRAIGRALELGLLS